MNRLYILLLFALFLGVQSTSAQTPTLRSFQKSANKAMKDKDFYSAWKYYSIALEIDSSRIQNIYNLGESARKFKSYEVAKKSYTKVMEHENKDEYPLTEFWLAKVYHSQANYDMAVTHYQNFLGKQVTPKGPSENSGQEYATLAKQSIQDCNWAKTQIQTPKTGYNIKPFGNGVNTPSSEFAPLAYQNQVFYSSLEYDEENFCPKPNSDVTRLYTSTDSAEGQPGPINWAKKEKGKFVTHTAYNGDDSRMYFTVCERLNASEFQCEIFYREKNNGLWGNATRLPDHVNQKGSNNTQPNIGYDENTGKELLFFVSNRAAEAGKPNSDLNIFCSIIEADGKVNAPVKLSINTPKDDVTPFYNKKNKNLYFSSEGHQGFGGFDIFKSEKNGSNFAKPVAMEYPLNTSYDDLYFSTDETMSNSYFSSNRLGVVYKEEGMETCCNDIFKLEYIKVDLIANVFNGLSKTGLDSSSVALYDATTGLQLEQKLDPLSNKYFFPLDLEKEYMVVSSREGRWTMDTTYVSTMGIKTSKTLETDLNLLPNVDLITNTYDGETKEELTGCTFKFYDEETGDLILETESLEDNRFYSQLEFGKQYRVVAEKDGYTSDEVSFNTLDLTTSKTFVFPLYLYDPNINLSILLYFDNDEPDKRTRRTTTPRSYDVVYNDYVKEERIDQFLEENGKGLEGEIRLKAQEKTQLFFDDQVKRGMTQLELFARFLEKYIPQGRTYQLEVEGFASPRAPSDYNKNLTSRRVSSVENYLRRYNGGVLAPYIGPNKNLRITLIPRGEDPSAELNIPSEISDPKSIYSIEASEQRKVEIVRIKRIDGKRGMPNNATQNGN